MFLRQKTSLLLYFSVSDPIFFINPFFILTPKRVLKKDYEIVKEAGYEQRQIINRKTEYYTFVADINLC